MGKWHWREADQHKCDYPKHAVPRETQVGDIWECACGKRWRVKEIKEHPGDARSVDPRERATIYTAKFEPWFVRDPR